MSAVRRVAGWTLLAALLILLALQLWYFGWIVLWRWHNPGETAFMQRELARIQLTRPKATLRHQWVDYDRISDHLKRAVIAAEDARFVEHEGVDWEAIQKAYEANRRRGRRARGGSPITQQLARNLFLTRDQTFIRKIREQIVALAMERRFTKQQIMELYLNRVYFGGGAYGIDAAARKFFGHSATRLSLEQAAIIAGLVKAPSRYSPTADPERARDRAKVVIATMADSGAITPAQAQEADVASVRFVVNEREGSIRYFTDWVLGQLDTLVEEENEPLEVQTTLVPAQQAAATRAVRAAEPPAVQAALLALRPDGAITAMVGGRDYGRSIYNRAVVARRQPGSSFKLFTYLVALEEGMKPDDMVVDQPVAIGNWSPRNYNGRFAGPVPLRTAFAQSINTVAVQLGARYGFDAVARMARCFGITTPIDQRPAMVLGASDVTLTEMTAAYAAIANEGREVRPWGIQSIATASGRLLYNHARETPRVLVAPFVAAEMTDLLHAAVETGTGRAAQIGRPLAGKTGTTSSSKDGWFIGFTPDLVAGVWVGRDDARAVPGLAGGQAPARIFRAFMTEALSGTPVSELMPTAADTAPAVEPDMEVYGLEQPQAPATPTSEPADPPADAPAPLTDAWLEGVTRAPADQPGR
jgi:penicillin-binding protein 1A